MPLFLEQGTGIEPAFTAWEAVVLPIYEPCVTLWGYYTKAFLKKQGVFGGQCPLIIRAKCLACRHFPGPLGIVSAQGKSHAQGGNARIPHRTIDQPRRAAACCRRPDHPQVAGFCEEETGVRDFLSLRPFGPPPSSEGGSGGGKHPPYGIGGSTVISFVIRNDKL